MTAAFQVAMECSLILDGILLGRSAAQDNEEGAALACGRFDPYPAVVLLDDPATDGKPDATARNVEFVMGSSEEAEDPFMILLSDADAFIAEGEQVLAGVGLLDADADLRLVPAAVLD